MTLHPDWVERTDAKGDKWWSTEYLGHFATILRFGQTWEGKVWWENDNDPGHLGYWLDPHVAKADLQLLIEAAVQGAS